MQRRDTPPARGILDPIRSRPRPGVPIGILSADDAAAGLESPKIRGPIERLRAARARLTETPAEFRHRLRVEAFERRLGQLCGERRPD